jgi:diaminohydroxyphosphoribosylaminopyrimidine deaminase/5-amino-6-(5-phosphoribosylamino)uracil reductase
VIGCRDPFHEVDGKGIEKLKAAGIETEESVLVTECRELNKRFFTFHIQHRPYIILKWAQNIHGKISSGNHQRLLISNEYTNRLVHKWRSEEASILVGTNTAWMDDPELTTRLWHGASPVRMVVDLDLRLPSTLKLFNGMVRTVIFNTIKHGEEGGLLYYQVTNETNLVHQVCNALYQMNLQSLLVEGGAGLLQSFIDTGMWDEIRRIENQDLEPGIQEKGLNSPLFENAIKRNELILSDDKIEIFYPLPGTPDEI